MKHLAPTVPVVAYFDDETIQRKVTHPATTATKSVRFHADAAVTKSSERNLE
jgi:hypothetical protein